MSGSPRSPGDGDSHRTMRPTGRPSARPASERMPAGGAAPGETQPLRLAIVSYEDTPDRATVHPPGLTGLDRMETWLSVDLSAVVELEAWR
ncbi:DUF7511 domain-containing protein [Halobellus sp. GM3]|uniref:DUF7511 domain-containing protein n=1 Tax=Halobellus sp. GM3 TaxID=3458410 RepID=UPI00403DF7DC